MSKLKHYKEQEQDGRVVVNSEVMNPQRIDHNDLFTNFCQWAYENWQGVPGGKISWDGEELIVTDGQDIISMNRTEA